MQALSDISPVKGDIPPNCLKLCREEAWMNLNFKNLGFGVWFWCWQTLWKYTLPEITGPNCLSLSSAKSIFTKEKVSKSFKINSEMFFNCSFWEWKREKYNISNFEALLQRNNQFCPPPDSKLCARAMKYPKVLFNFDLEIKSIIVVYPTHVNDNCWTDDSLFSDLLWGEPGNITLLVVMLHFTHLFYTKRKHTFPRQSKIDYIYFENIQITYIFAFK